ncbi:MAG: hypothetical protein K6F34_05035 [Lachnospiraceae bacterium]|nr:hypothetical protein [Lachnospiraceae bacterium]
MTVCSNCGAQIDKDIDKCPYCGYINKEGAEKKFRSKLNKIKDNIEDTKKEPGRALVKGVFSGVRIILTVLGILVILAILFGLELAREMKNHPKEFLSAEEQAYASAYKAKAAEELAKAYDDKDIESMARIFDKAYSVDRVNLWGVDHYETGRAASYYMKLKQCLPNLDKTKMKKTEAEQITYYCFYFYYGAYGEDGAQIFDPIRDEEIIPIITGRLGFTVEDMEGFRDKVFDPPYVNRSRVYKVTKKYFKNYM